MHFPADCRQLAAGAADDLAMPCMMFRNNLEDMHIQDLDHDDICYDKCTKGKPCHTCIFKDVSPRAWCHSVVPAHGTS